MRVNARIMAKVWVGVRARVRVRVRVKVKVWAWVRIKVKFQSTNVRDRLLAPPFAFLLLFLLLFFFLLLHSALCQYSCSVGHVDECGL